ncbi:hypothetical protein F7725_016820, partial [Dissostichus mawsoni]
MQQCRALICLWDWEMGSVTGHHQPVFSEELCECSELIAPSADGAEEKDSTKWSYSCSLFGLSFPLHADKRVQGVISLRSNGHLFYSSSSVGRSSSRSRSSLGNGRLCVAPDRRDTDRMSSSRSVGSSFTCTWWLKEQTDVSEARGQVCEGDEESERENSMRWGCSTCRSCACVWARPRASGSGSECRLEELMTEGPWRIGVIGAAAELLDHLHLDSALSSAAVIEGVLIVQVPGGVDTDSAQDQPAMTDWRRVPSCAGCSFVVSLRVRARVFLCVHLCIFMSGCVFVCGNGRLSQ